MITRDLATKFSDNQGFRSTGFPLALHTGGRAHAFGLSDCFWPIADKLLEVRLNWLLPTQSGPVQSFTIMSDYLFYAFMATVIFYLAGMPIVIHDIKKNYPKFYESINGSMFFYSPFKQLDFLLWIVKRSYLVGSDSKLHRYDLFLGNLIAVVIIGSLFGLSMK